MPSSNSADPGGFSAHPRRLTRAMTANTAIKDRFLGASRMMDFPRSARGRQTEVRAQSLDLLLQCGQLVRRAIVSIQFEVPERRLAVAVVVARRSQLLVKDSFHGARGSFGESSFGLRDGVRQLARPDEGVDARRPRLPAIFFTRSGPPSLPGPLLGIHRRTRRRVFYGLRGHDL